MPAPAPTEESGKGHGLSPDIYDDTSDSVPGAWKKQIPDDDQLEKVMKYVGSETGIATTILDNETLNKFASGGDWEWERYQLEYLKRKGNYLSNKGRRMGISSAFAMKAFAKGILASNQDYNSIFVSHNQQEAINKVNYVKKFLHALPPKFKKPIKRDPRQLIEWDNLDGTTSRIISHPQKAIRGMEGDIYLDEFAHYQYDHKIYESATYSTGMKGYTIDITSTPFGKNGLFYNMFSNESAYPDFDRMHLKWWFSKRYLKKQSDKFHAYAQSKAKQLNDVEERVLELGNENVKQLYRNSTEKSFLQEMEGRFIDESSSYYGRDLILSCSFPESRVRIEDYDPKEDEFNVPVEEALGNDEKWPIVRKYETNKDINFEIYDKLEELYQAVRRGELSPRLVAGADLGGRRHSTEIVILEEIPIKVRGKEEVLQIERYNYKRKDWSLPDQQKKFEEILGAGFVQILAVDTTSIGQQMADDMEGKWGERFEPLHMGGGQKTHDFMTNLHARFEEQQIAISARKRKLHDLMNIRRTVTDSKNYKYHAPSTKKGHSDYAWALAFASMAGTTFGEAPRDLNFTEFSQVNVNFDHQVKAHGQGGEIGDRSLSKKLLGDMKEAKRDMGLGTKEDISLGSIDDPGDFNQNYEN